MLEECVGKNCILITAICGQLPPPNRPQLRRGGREGYAKIDQDWPIICEVRPKLTLTRQIPTIRKKSANFFWGGGGGDLPTYGHRFINSLFAPFWDTNENVFVDFTLVRFPQQIWVKNVQNFTGDSLNPFVFSLNSKAEGVICSRQHKSCFESCFVRSLGSSSNWTVISKD